MSFFDPNFIVPMNEGSPINKLQLNSLKYLDYSSVNLNVDRNYSFSDVFKNAIQDVITTDRDYVNKQYLLATGQIDNAADVTIAGAKAQLAVDLLVQMRNSVLTAYNEILRINV